MHEALCVYREKFFPPEKKNVNKAQCYALNDVEFDDNKFVGLLKKAFSSVYLALTMLT